MSNIDGLDRWSEIGGRILSIRDAEQVDRDLSDWIVGVAAWISAVVPDSGFQAHWFSIEPLVSFGTPIERAHKRVRERLDWLKRFPSEIDHKQAIEKLRLFYGHKGASNQNSEAAAPGAAIYVSPIRITELRHVTGRRFSTRTLVRFCEELNACMATESYLSAIMLVRSINNHVPPIFGCANFDEVVAQTNGRSFNSQLKRLNSQAKDVAQRFLHEQIGPVEALPTRQQVDFASELDALLGEVAELLRTKWKS